MHLETKSMSKTPILQIKDLVTYFYTPEGVVHAVNNVSIDLHAGETLGVVGESGCGKSVTMLSALRLLPSPPGKIEHGEVIFDNRDLLKLPDREIRDIRGRQIAMIFQDPIASLNPVYKIGNQVVEPLTRHTELSKEEAYERAVEMLELVGIPEARRRMNNYPHQFSGGMRQRAMIAMALACNPQILIADEPTTALDVTIQAQIVDLMKELRDRLGMSIIWITHDLGVVAGLAHRVIVMYAGFVIEEVSVSELYTNPKHPYTIGLLSSLPRIDGSSRSSKLAVIPGTPPLLWELPKGCPFRNSLSVCYGCLRAESASARGWSRASGSLLGGSERWKVTPMTEVEPLVKVRNLVKHFPIHGGILMRQVGAVHAVDGISFDIFPGETFGLVGELGCGKSTTGRAVIQLDRPSSGEVIFDGVNLVPLKGGDLRRMRRRMQMIYQDPYSSLNPRMTVREIIAEPVVVHGLIKWKEADSLVAELLKTVQLSPDFASRYPHEFSGGQRQRIGIARAISLKPEFIVCDEPISALDVSIQAQVVNLLEELQEKMGLTYLFIAHDLAMVRHISTRVGVMYLGMMAEMTGCDELFENPLHPYTKALLSAVPVPNAELSASRKRTTLKGDVPSPVNPPSGCRFRTRCPIADKVCEEETPAWREISPGHWVACHFS